MYKYTIYVGRNTKKGTEQQRTICYATIVNILLENNIKGATLLDAIGVWEGKTEKSIQVIVYSNTCINKDIYNAIYTINTVLDQTCCLVETEKECNIQYL